MKRVSKILHYVKSIQGLAKHPSNKSMVRQIVEVFCLFLRSRLGPGFYLEAKLYESSTAVSTLLGFLSISEYKKTVNRLNNRLYQRCSQNKVVEKAVLTAYGIPTPQLLGHFQVERGYGVNGCPLRERGDFFRLLAAQEPGEKFCIKFVESWGGQGFRAFEVVDDESVLDLATGKQKNHDQLYSEIEKDVGDGLIIEKYLKQHPAYSEFNQSSLNTYRVLVIKKSNSLPKVLGAYLRVGRTGQLVDNATSGGVIYPIDIQTGRLREGFVRKASTIRFSKHPDSGLTMAGRTLIGFEEGLKLAERALLAFPEINFAGVDIAFDNNGPCVLELNVLPDYNGFAAVKLPTRQSLDL